MNKSNFTQNNQFELLREKSILAILDGDTKFKTFKVNDSEGEIPICMPYLSGSRICEISYKFGLPNSGGGSRWQSLDKLISYCIKNGKISKLLNFLFSKQQFYQSLKDYSPSTIDSAHAKMVKYIIDEINKILFFGENELIKIGENFVIRTIGTTVTPEIPLVKNIDRSYIKNILDRSLNDINDGNFDSAITKARTLFEEVFCYVIEEAAQEPSTKGDIGLLYKQVKQIYNMQQNKDFDKRVNNLLSGLEKILSSIAEMRNKSSDAHGLGSNKIKIEEHIARLLVNSSAIMAEFILSVCKKRKNNITI